MTQQAMFDDSRAPHLQVDYVDSTTLADWLAQPDVLAVFGFGPGAPGADDPRYLRVPLAPLGEAPLEVWRGNGIVESGYAGAIRCSSDGELLFGAIEVAEGEGGIEEASRTAYAAMSAFVADRGFPHLLRIWNYLDAITHGEGDAERYRQFCVGRAQGLGAFETELLPAATAIGRCDDERVLQVYWLAAKAPGKPVENPRQVSAYRYPRQYGPQSPSFARAMLPPARAAMPLLLSGTAAVVGHASQHSESVPAQLDETLANLDSLVGAARGLAPALPAAFGPGSPLKVYVRRPADEAAIAAQLDALLDPPAPRLLLHAHVCRRELLVEIDGAHGAATGI